MQEFDRNNFKAFVDNNIAAEKQKCSRDHTEIVKHHYFKKAEWKSSFRSISDLELDQSYILAGKLPDDKIKRLDYMEYNEKPGVFWSADSPIATNFYPYNSCDVYRCKECNKLFLVYTEHGGHGPDQRIRIVKPELIVEEPSNCTLKISEENIPTLLEYLKIDHSAFEKMLDETKGIDRISSNFDIEKIMVKRRYEDYYLFIAKRDIIYDLIERFE